MQEESVVIGQRQRIGSQFVQLRVVQAEWRLHRPWPLLLVQEIADVVGAEGAGGMGFVQSSRYGFRSILTNQIQQFSDLTAERAVRVRQALQVEFASGTEPGHEALLSGAALRGRPLGQELFLEPLRPEHLATLPAADVGNNLLMLVVESYRTGIGLHGKPAADVAWGRAVAIAVEGQA
jgi:hypothetical protein